MWQKCPICNGTGGTYINAFKDCSLCKGAMIISELTGLPPNQEFHKKLRKDENIPNINPKNLLQEIFKDLTKDVNPYVHKSDPMGDKTKIIL